MMSWVGLFVMVLPVLAQADHWAVIAAGSQGFGNYRHQTDACHAYQILVKSGIKPANIIVMMQDDVAAARSNPFPGKLFNKPGDDAVDVYEGCDIDYRGKVVTAKLFLSVITGDESGVPAGGKVLKSGSNDRVFLYFVDHGGKNIIAFPNGPTLHSTDLIDAMNTMFSKNMYQELLFYMEACESGSMFKKLADDKKVFAVTAANAKESSWGWYCPPNDVVHGKKLGSCLGDQFSISWMEDSDLGQLQTESIKTQVARVTKRTNKSHVTTFGDMSFDAEPLIGFESTASLRDVRDNVDATYSPHSAEEGIDARDVDIHIAYYSWLRADASEKAAAWKNLQSVMRNRERTSELFGNMAADACASRHECVERVLRNTRDLVDLACHKQLVLKVHEACPRLSEEDAGGWTSYGTQFSQALGNLCDQRSDLGLSSAQLEKIVQDRCDGLRDLVTKHSALDIVV